MAEQNPTHAPDPLFDDVAPAAPTPAVPAPASASASANVDPVARVLEAREEFLEAKAALRAAGPPEEPRKLTLVDTRPQLRATLDRIAQKRAHVRREIARLGVRKRKPYPALFELNPKGKG